SLALRATRCPRGGWSRAARPADRCSPAHGTRRCPRARGPRRSSSRPAPVLGDPLLDHRGQRSERMARRRRLPEPRCEPAEHDLFLFGELAQSYSRLAVIVDSSCRPKRAWVAFQIQRRACANCCCLTSRVRAPTIPWQSRRGSMELQRDYNAAVDLVGRNLAAGRGSKIAYIDDTETCTYAQLAERVDRAANVLHSMDIRRQERIGVA